jgi:hypothetical protein
MHSDATQYTISCLNTRHNPDLIVPGGTLKGNMYFKEERRVEPTGDSDDNDHFFEVSRQTRRYFNELNPTIKCNYCG